MLTSKLPALLVTDVPATTAFGVSRNALADAAPASTPNSRHYHALNYDAVTYNGYRNFYSTGGGAMHVHYYTNDYTPFLSSPSQQSESKVRPLR